MIDTHKEPYTTALLNGRAEEWNRSFFENRRCAEFLSKLAERNEYDSDEVPDLFLEKAVDEFGYDRTMWVIANSIMLGKPPFNVCKLRGMF